MNATSVLSSEKIPQMVSEQTDKNQREINFQRHLAKGRQGTLATACFAPFPGVKPVLLGH
jgi:hypothetical protein